MYEELRKKAEEKVDAKLDFYITAIVFGFTSLILLILSYIMPAIRFWLVLPILVFMMVLAIIYVSVFGLTRSGSFSEDWKEDEIDKEMMKLIRQQRRQYQDSKELNDADRLQLKELEKLEEKWDLDDD